MLYSCRSKSELSHISKFEMSYKPTFSPEKASGSYGGVILTTNGELPVRWALHGTSYSFPGKSPAVTTPIYHSEGGQF
jgi:hypothetical protein